MRAVELDADCLERVLQFVSDSGLLRAAHTARALDTAWNAAVNVRSTRLREVQGSTAQINLPRLLFQMPNLAMLETAYSPICPAVCKRLDSKYLKELHLGNCSLLDASDLVFVSSLTQLSTLKLGRTRGTASAVLAQCSNLRNLRTLQLQGFTSLAEKLMTNLIPLTGLQHLSLLADEDSKATLRSLSMQLLSWCTPHLTSFECGKLESTYPLAALRGLEHLQVLSLTNCKLFLNPDCTGHDLLAELAHLTQVASVSLKQLPTRAANCGQIVHDMQQLKHLKGLHVQQGSSRGMLEGLTALTNLAELVLLDELTHIQSRSTLSQVLPRLHRLTKLELRVSGDVLVEGFRLFRNLPYLRQLKFEGVHCEDKGLLQLFWGLTSLVAPVTSLSFRNADFSWSLPGLFHTAAGSQVIDLDLGRFPMHGLKDFAKVFPDVTSLRLIVDMVRPVLLQDWVKLQELFVDWQPLETMAEVDPVFVCASLAGLPELRQVTLQCPAAGRIGNTSCFALLKHSQHNILQLLPGVDVYICQSEAS